MKGRDCIDFQIIQVDRLKNSTKSKILLYCISVKKDVPYKQINKHYQLSFCDSFLQQCQISSNGHHSEGYEDWLRLGVSFSPISTVASTQEMKSIFRNLICHYLWYWYQACWINPSLHLSVLQQHLVFETTTSPTQLFTVQPSFVHSWSASQDKVSSCFTSSSQSSSLHWWSPLENKLIWNMF